MKILKNSAKCTACGVEIESTHRHDFKLHYCGYEPTQELKWEGEGEKARLVPTGNYTFRFGVDGGKDYLRRLGSGFEDTSVST